MFVFSFLVFEFFMLWYKLLNDHLTAGALAALCFSKHIHVSEILIYTVYARKQIYT